MFDDYAQSLFSDFPEFEGLTRANATRVLSAAYLSIVQHRANGPDASPKTRDEEQPYLRRLANTLLFHVVLRPNREPAARQAAAFVAAESIALMADYLALDRESQRQVTVGLRSAEQFARLESALLYLFAQYDACASAVLRPSSNVPPDANLVDRAARWALSHLERLCRLQLHPPFDSDLPFVHTDREPLSVEDLERDTIARLYGELGRISSSMLRWLGTTNETGSAEATAAQLQDLATALSPQPNSRGGGRTGHEFGRIYHLSTLLRLCWPTLQDRALLHVVSSPTAANPDQYRRYLESRAVGDTASASRPVLWPSAVAYVKECILGDTRHAVVSMPTGAGKSFIGELAVSQAVGDGWALYLAPTNALAEQIRGDLRTGLKALATDVLAFLGDQEYSILEADRVVAMPANSVAVMTPEKCALALRLSPTAFSNCRLVVFDECHLLGESSSTRGPLAELVLTQLMLRAQDSRFLLMSAIVQNPEELADWLQESTGGRGKPLRVHWRPTRTLRTVLGVDDSSYRRGLREATDELATLPSNRTRQKFRAKCAVAANLRGPWQTEDEDDYRVVGLQCDAGLAVRRQRVGGKWRYTPLFERWVNDTATTVATQLVEGGVRTLVFTPANRNYPFTNGRKVRFSIDASSARSAKPQLVDACEVLAEYELGCRFRSIRTAVGRGGRTYRFNVGDRKDRVRKDVPGWRRLDNVRHRHSRTRIESSSVGRYYRGFAYRRSAG